jgi:pimeloyl-ACP methyl ester carboxylesterase
MDKRVMRARRGKRKARGGLGSLLALPVIAAGSWIAYSNAAIDHDLPLPKAIDAERETFFSKSAGQLSYYADRSAGGRPLVFIHSINAAGSAYEFRPLFEHYRGRRPLYALDLPGFGFSERSDRVYSPELYEAAILEFLASRVGGPADVVALSLGSEFAARAALAQPDLFHSLTLISPSGFNLRGQGGRSSQRVNENGTSDTFYSLFSFPLWGRALFDLIATQRSIQFFLKQSFVGAVDAGMAAFDYATSHQPGAHYAPLYFVSGKLFTRDVRDRVYDKLQLPVLVIYDRDGFTTFEALPEFLQKHANWRGAQITPTLGLPQFERLQDTARALEVFWEANP